MNDDIISQHALQQAAKAIRMTLGDLSDLPYELANTYANIYYRAFAYEEHVSCGGRSRFLEPYMPESSNIFDANADNVRFQAETLAAFEHAQAVVQSLRQLRLEDPDLFSHAVTTVLDTIKYNIDDVESKTPIRRAFERKFKKVYEVPQLLDIMRSRGLCV